MLNSMWGGILRVLGLFLAQKTAIALGCGRRGALPTRRLRASDDGRGPFCSRAWNVPFHSKRAQGLFVQRSSDREALADLESPQRGSGLGSFLAVQIAIVETLGFQLRLNVSQLIVRDGSLSQKERQKEQKILFHGSCQVWTRRRPLSFNVPLSPASWAGREQGGGTFDSS